MIVRSGLTIYGDSAYRHIPCKSCRNVIRREWLVSRSSVNTEPALDPASFGLRACALNPLRPCEGTLRQGAYFYIKDG